jgi:uncharacterized glyoxalase superfamily protein PhnB
MTFYRDCFGGELTLQEFEGPLFRYPQLPVISARLCSDELLLLASDLVHSEGQLLGNHIAIFFACATNVARQDMVHRLSGGSIDVNDPEFQDQVFIEFTDLFEIRWIIGLL